MQWPSGYLEFYGSGPEMKRCLIAGASGLIGSHLTQHLSNHWEIYGISRTVPRFCNLKHRFIHLPIDLSKNWDADSLPKKIDALIHLVHPDHYRDFPEYAQETFYTNVVSTMGLLEYARTHGARTFILASSGGIYGYRDRNTSDEAPALLKGSLDFYQGIKFCSEILAENYTSFINIIILRLFFVYGPEQKQTMLIPRLINSVVNDLPLILHGSHGIQINPTYVSDAVEAIAHALSLEKSEKIDIGGPDILSIRRIGKIIGSVLNKKPLFSIQKHTKPVDMVGDIHKMSTLLAPPKIHFDQGIRSVLSN